MFEEKEKTEETITEEIEEKTEPVKEKPEEKVEQEVEKESTTEKKEEKPEIKETESEKKDVKETSTSTGKERSGDDNRPQPRRPYRDSKQSGQYRRGGKGKSKFMFKKKGCYFCKNKDVIIDYKDVNLMRRYIADSGKISPRRFTGTCAKHQRKLAREIKKARQMSLVSYTGK
jgi:small subunit ribosomal protein S18